MFRKLFSTLIVALSICGAIIVLAVAPPGTHASPNQWKTEGWRTDFSKKNIEWHEIMSGGPPRDGIPSIDNPVFTALAGASRIGSDEPVISLEINGDARAYPLSILTWHEIVNDIVGGVPVAITYCPLCNAAIVFDRRVGSHILDFGTTGKLRNSDLVMYDRQTESWWQQFTGEAIVGSKLGVTLKTLPVRLSSFSRFKNRYKKALVLIPNDPDFRAYGRNPYVGYDRAKMPFLYQGDMPKGINPMARVVVIKQKSQHLAVTLNHLRTKGTLIIGGVHLSWEKGQNSALDTDRISQGRDVGNVVAQVKGANGKRLDIKYDVTFAFVFHAFHPESAIINK